MISEVTRGQRPFFKKGADPNFWYLCECRGITRRNIVIKLFGGACPPEGSKPHTYIFTVFALNAEKLDLDENAPPTLVGFMLNQHVIQKASIIAYYNR